MGWGHPGLNGIKKIPSPLCWKAGEPRGWEGSSLPGGRRDTRTGAPAARGPWEAPPAAPRSFACPRVTSTGGRTLARSHLGWVGSPESMESNTLMLGPDTWSDFNLPLLILIKRDDSEGFWGSELTLRPVCRWIWKREAPEGEKPGRTLREGPRKRPVSGRSGMSPALTPE